MCATSISRRRPSDAFRWPKLTLLCPCRIIRSSLSELKPVRQKRTFVDFGPNTLTLAGVCLAENEGALLRGHEFHYASIEAKGERDPPFAFVQDAYGGGERAEGNRRGKVSGSFFHVIAADERNGMGPRSIQ
jgi:hypothetical protein